MQEKKKDVLFDVLKLWVSDGFGTVRQGSGQVSAAERVGLERERPPTACI